MEIISTSNPANPTNDPFNGKTQWAKEPNGLRAYQEVVTDYMDGFMPNTTVIPSALSRVTGDSSKGGQANGFDPHKPGKQLLFDTANGINQVGVLDPNEKQAAQPKQQTTMKPQKKAFIDPAAAPKKATPVAQLDVPAPGEIVYLHMPGMKVPFKYHEIIIDPDKGVVILVLDTRSSPDNIPQFDPTNENHIVMSFDNYPNILFCEYYGQTFTVARYLNVTLLVIAGEQPKE